MFAALVSLLFDFIYSFFPSPVSYLSSKDIPHKNKSPVVFSVVMSVANKFFSNLFQGFPIPRMLFTVFFRP